MVLLCVPALLCRCTPDLTNLPCARDENCPTGLQCVAFICGTAHGKSDGGNTDGGNTDGGNTGGGSTGGGSTGGGTTGGGSTGGGSAGGGNTGGGSAGGGNTGGGNAGGGNTGGGSPDAGNCLLVDAPDLAFLDSDCDGIDGTEASAIFVSPNGLDSWPGTRGQPKATLRSAITAAVDAGRSAILAAVGTYPASLDLSDPVSIYGGYVEPGWTRTRDAGATIIQSPTPEGARIVGLDGSVELQLLTVQSANAIASGESSVGLLVRDVSSLVLREVTVGAGQGATSSDETLAQQGADGGSAVGRDGGSSACGASGGDGATGVSGTTAGLVGEPGLQVPGGGRGGDGGVSGQGGSCGVTGGSPGSAPVSPGGAGATGPAGVAGTPGPALGSLSPDGTYLPTRSGAGSAGGPGGGGGGGGSGGGTSRITGTLCTSCSALGPSGGGGGGGGGACGGAAGTGGLGGGASFSVVVLRSRVSFDGAVLRPSRGGRGGSGGPGGAGGQGGAGAPGATGAASSGSCAATQTGAGARGGPGGAGGLGGGGAGGAGGPSACVIEQASMVTRSGVTCEPAAASLGGLGGGVAPSGLAGVADTFVQLP